MGWKAAEKLIRHWKVVRGDNVSQTLIHSFILSMLFLIIILSSVTGYDYKGQR